MSKEVSPVNTPNSGKHDVTVSASLSAGLDLPVGRIINERYKIIEELGRGGMGVVYRVQQIALGREMALKTLDGTDIADETWLRFQQEAKATSMLDHPNLISVHDYGIIDGKHPFFVMDLVEGSTLSQIIKKEGPLTVEKAIPIFIQVCFGLAYAHELGIVHRDLKPSNIMVLKTDAANSGVGVKIVDFGIAKLKTPEGTEAQGLTKTGEVFGSPLYMSPEQCLGNRIDHRSDIYAIGCVLFEALTGLPPFMGSTALSTMMMHQAEKPPSLKEATLGKEFPAELQEIVYRLLEKEPNARYQSLGALAHDLSLLQQGSATVALNLPSSIENQKKQKKETILLGSVLGLIACIIVGTGVYFFKDQADNKLY
ncbi:MAG TPA: serine/threonine-protein kinase, partial [Candidatus Melainabacteria bacterium]|nr:serine/threonine-protein kinase [Candidatus Melainabacteria bacterium]